MSIVQRGGPTIVRERKLVNGMNGEADITRREYSCGCVVCVDHWKADRKRHLIKCPIHTDGLYGISDDNSL